MGLGRQPGSNLLKRLHERKWKLECELREVDETIKLINEDAGVQKLLQVLEVAEKG